jgi:hypothetical protein
MTRYKALQEAAEPLVELAKKEADVGDLDSLRNFLDENLVRAISAKYLNNGDAARSQRLQEAMMQEYRSGQTLETRLLRAAQRLREERTSRWASIT